MPKRTWNGGGIVEGVGISFNGGGFAGKPERQRIKNDEAERDREREERAAQQEKSSETSAKSSETSSRKSSKSSESSSKPPSKEKP